MNPKTIIASIERNHTIMEAQIEKLGEHSPKLPHSTLEHGDASANVASLLNNAVRAHLQGAADALSAIAEVEANIRHSVKSAQPSADSSCCEPPIIDGEFVIIEPKESK